MSESRAEAVNALNPYLQGPYAPVQSEVTAIGLPVTGEIPGDLNGVYVRNGPNPVRPPRGMHHWFDGDGMLHGIYFENGRAEYRNRYVRSTDFQSGQAGDEERPGIFQPARAGAGTTVYKDTANTDVVCHAGELLALWYISGQPVRVDPRTLETLRTESFSGRLPNNVSAHSKVDPATGEFLFFDYALYEPWLSFGVVSPDNELEHFTQVEVPGPRLPHDMAITQNYAVLMDLPIVFTEQGLKNRTWHIHQGPGLPTRFGVLPRRGQGSDVRWFEFPPCYIYHVVNAWEEGDEIVLYGCRMVDNGRPMDQRFGPYAAMVDVLALRAHLYCWRMNLKTGETREEQVDDAISEFPTINLQHTGRSSRYSYHVSIPDTPTQVFDGLIAYDLPSGRSVRHRFAQGVYGSEPAFAPRDGATAEDDGYLVTLVTNVVDSTSEALVLDAKNPDSPPLARVHLPQRVPLGFHATWAGASELAAD